MAKKAKKSKEASIFDIKECPDCASQNLIYNEERQQAICRDCGLIYEPLAPDIGKQFEASHRALPGRAEMTERVMVQLPEEKPAKIKKAKRKPKKAKKKAAKKKAKKAAKRKPKKAKKKAAKKKAKKAVKKAAKKKAKKKRVKKKAAKKAAKKKPAKKKAKKAAKKKAKKKQAKKKKKSLIGHLRARLKKKKR